MPNILKVLAGEASAVVMEKVPFGVGACFKILHDTLKAKQMIELNSNQKWMGNKIRELEDALNFLKKGHIPKSINQLTQNNQIVILPTFVGDKKEKLLSSGNYEIEALPEAQQKENCLPVLLDEKNKPLIYHIPIEQFSSLQEDNVAQDNALVINSENCTNSLWVMEKKVINWHFSFEQELLDKAIKKLREEAYG